MKTWIACIGLQWLWCYAGFGSQPAVKPAEVPVGEGRAAGKSPGRGELPGGAASMRIDPAGLPLKTSSAALAGDATVIDVYLQSNNLMWREIWTAKVLASEIFARIGVRLVWHPTPAGQPAIAIRWVDRAPLSLPGALASAHPFCSQEAAITLYEDRLQHFIQNHSGVHNVALAYVLAHELAHVLQGLERHSDSGILKPHWSDADFRQMASLKLDFAANDADLIHLGIDARARCHETT